MSDCRYRFVVFLVALCFCGAPRLAGAEEKASTQPAGASDRADLSNPRAALLAYDAQSDRGPEALARFYIAHDEDEKVRAQARVDAMLGILEIMTEKKWGTDGMNTVLHAFSFDTRTDVEAAQVSIDGDRAKVTCAGDQNSLELEKTPDGWKIDAGALKKSIAMPVEDYMGWFASMSPIISDVADEIASDKLKTPAAAAEEARRRIKSIGQKI